MGKKILLADDSITIQKVIELTFSDEDFEVVTVGNGRLAIERVLDVRPDIVLCDIIMPERDGYEVCDFIKRSPLLAHVPVLLLTGAFEPFDQERAARVGCDGFLAKPFEPQTLIAKVKELLSQAIARPAAPAPRPVPAPPAAPASTGLEVFSPPEDAFSAPEAVPAADPYGVPPEEPDVNFIPEEPFLEYGEAPVYEAPPELETPIAAAPADGEATVEQELYGVVDAAEPMDAVDAPPDELLTVTPEESASLGGTSAPDASSTSMSSGGRAPWQATMEVSLETRARAGMESIQRDSDAGIFEEVFEEETLNLKAPSAVEPPAAAAPSEGAAPAAGEAAPDWEPMSELESLTETPAEPLADEVSPEEEILPAAASVPVIAPPPEPEPAPAPTPAAPEPLSPPWAAAPLASPAVEPPPVTAVGREAPPVAQAARAVEAAFEPTFGDVEPVDAEPGPAPAAGGEGAVPVDMVAQIAQRVVAQISEKVVREIAWEVIPDLAEALIKREIERLKAELQHT